VDQKRWLLATIAHDLDPCVRWGHHIPMKLAHWMSLAAVTLSSNLVLAEKESPISASRFGISIDGVAVSATNVLGGGTSNAKVAADHTPLVISVDRTGADAMWSWITASINQGPVEKTVVAEAKGKRRATFAGATVTEVKLDDLDANNSKKPMQVTVTIVPKTIVDAKAIKGNLGMKQKSWNPANFRVKMGGLPAGVSKIDSFAIKQKVLEKDKPPVYVVENLRLIVDTSGAKVITDTLAKDKQKALAIELTNDDGTVWKTFTLSGLTAKTTKSSKQKSEITMKGSKILIN
jgi:hypothetical protein